MVNSFSSSASSAGLPAQSTSNKNNTFSEKDIVYTSEKHSTSKKDASSHNPPKSGKMAALKSMLKKDETTKRAHSVTSTSTEATLIAHNGKQVHNYDTAVMMRGQFRFTSG